MLLDCWLDWEVSSMDKQGQKETAKDYFFIQGWFSVEVDLLSVLIVCLKSFYASLAMA